MTQMTQPLPQTTGPQGHAPMQPRPVPVPTAPVPQVPMPQVQVPTPQAIPNAGQMAPQMAPQPIPQAAQPHPMRAAPAPVAPAPVPQMAAAAVPQGQMHPGQMNPGQMHPGQMNPGQMPPPSNLLDYAGTSQAPGAQRYAPLQEQSRDEGEKPLPSISLHAFCDRQETAHCINETTRDWRMKRANVKIYMGGLTSAIEFYHKENTPSLILIESGMRGEELFNQLEDLASVCDEGTKVVMIGAANDICLLYTSPSPRD